MDDEQVMARIKSLIEEEHALRSSAAGADPDRVRRVEETLDQCWDLLRQRRALREFGGDSTGAHARDVDTVEHYQQ
jgi:hypothetical protein